MTIIPGRALAFEGNDSTGRRAVWLRLKIEDIESIETMKPAATVFLP